MKNLGVLEGILFVVGDEGIDLKSLCDIMNISDVEVKELLSQLKKNYEADDRGLRISYLGDAFKLTTKMEHKEYYEKYYRPSLYFVDESLEILEGNGFFNDINEDTVITFTINNFIGWDGWGYPVFGVEIDGKTYLDFETGYDNVLNYVKDQIIKYS